jgi:LCP family protein required for cell wall assembly
VLLCAAGGTAVFVLEQVHSLSQALGQNKSLHIDKNVLASAGWGAPETILLVGDDTRRGFKYYHGFVPDLANEMLLVRLDPSKPYISMMSIPRELDAMIYPGHGQLPFLNRLNEAYHFGINPLVNSIKHDLGLSINHVVIATFASFKKAVDRMGCVYSTVDQRYYHVNQPGSQQYQEINLQPGYQRLCGQQALEFVSYRHTDTSLVRDARDQSFLLDVKKEFGPTLVDNVDKFERIFGAAVVTDPGLKSQTQLLDLLGTLIKMASAHVRQVHFQVNLQPSVDTATPQQIHASVHDFLYGKSAVPTVQSVTAQAKSVHGKRAVAHLPLVATPSSALGQARSAAAKLPFPLEFPRVEDRSGSWQASSLRTYKIKAPGGTAYPAYVGVFRAGGLGNYYDVQGMSWTTAPQFDSPDWSIKVGGRTYQLFYESSHLRMIAWYEHDAVYWVRNTLTDSVSNGEMLAIAEQTRPFTVAGSGRGSAPLILHAAHVPFPTTAKKKIPLKQTIGGAAALATLLGLPLLLFFGIRRFLDLRKARFMLAGGEEIGQRLPVGEMPVAMRPSPVPLLASQGAFADGGSSLLTGRRAGSVHWVGRPTVYRRSVFGGRRMIIWILLLLAAAGAAAAVLITRHHGQAAPVHHVKRVRRPVIPTVPVAVLNATPLPGAAHKLAVSLKADHIKVPTVGNLSASLPPGNEILYAPGRYSQAKRLDHLLGGKVPIEPIDPVVAQTVGSSVKLVVVITS